MEDCHPPCPYAGEHTSHTIAFATPFLIIAVLCFFDKVVLMGFVSYLNAV